MGGSIKVTLDDQRLGKVYSLLIDGWNSNFDIKNLLVLNGSGLTDSDFDDFFAAVLEYDFRSRYQLPTTMYGVLVNQFLTHARNRIHTLIDIVNRTTEKQVEVTFQEIVVSQDYCLSTKSPPADIQIWRENTVNGVLKRALWQAKSDLITGLIPNRDAAVQVLETLVAEAIAKKDPKTGVMAVDDYFMTASSILTHFLTIAGVEIGKGNIEHYGTMSEFWQSMAQPLTRFGPLDQLTPAHFSVTLDPETPETYGTESLFRVILHGRLLATHDKTTLLTKFQHCMLDDGGKTYEWVQTIERLETAYRLIGGHDYRQPIPRLVITADDPFIADMKHSLSRTATPTTAPMTEVEKGEFYLKEYEDLAFRALHKFFSMDLHSMYHGFRDWCKERNIKLKKVSSQYMVDNLPRAKAVVSGNPSIWPTGV